MSKENQMSDRSQLQAHEMTWLTMRAAQLAVAPKKFPFVYMPVGKAANTTIKNWIAHFDERDRPSNESTLNQNDYLGIHKRFKMQDDDLSLYLNLDKSQPDRLFSAFHTRPCFTVVRNPYTRLLSGYLDKVERNLGNQEKLRRQFQLPKNVKNFDTFVDHVSQTNDGFLNIHWCSQASLVCNDLCYASIVGFVETLDTFFFMLSSIMEEAPTQRAPSTRATHATGASNKIGTYYTDANIEKVKERFKEDFQTFGYDEDIANLMPRTPLLVQEDRRNSERTELSRSLMRVRSSKAPLDLETLEQLENTEFVHSDNHASAAAAMLASGQRDAATRHLEKCLLHAEPYEDGFNKFVTTIIRRLNHESDNAKAFLDRVQAMWHSPTDV